MDAWKSISTDYCEEENENEKAVFEGFGVQDVLSGAVALVKNPVPQQFRMKPRYLSDPVEST